MLRAFAVWSTTIQPSSGKQDGKVQQNVSTELQSEFKDFFYAAFATQLSYKGVFLGRIFVCDLYPIKRQPRDSRGGKVHEKRIFIS